MGRDGTAGAAEIEKAGGRVVAEAEETSVVYGMPRSVVETVDVDRQAPLYDMAEVIMQMV